MTALLIVEHHRMREWVKVPLDIKDPESSLAHLPAGEVFTVGDLLTALLVNSSNEAAVTLARFQSGSVPAFVALMNQRAATLGLRHTSFDNPVGLDAPLQRSTPQDLAWLASFVWRFPRIRERMGEQAAIIHSRGGKTVSLIHTNLLVRTDPSEVIAGKTGTTDDAGQCLLSIVQKGGHQYVAILLHSSNRYRDMSKLLSAMESTTALKMNTYAFEDRTALLPLQKNL
jgi:D-alanyl-D-alanine carboxypeptidase (penicillin-binding protein 5/6)